MKKYIFLRNKTFRPSSYYRIFQYIKNYNNIIISEFENDTYYKINKYRNKFVNYLNKIIFMLIVGYCRRIRDLIIISIDRGEYSLLIQRATFPKVIGPVGKRMIRNVIIRAKNVVWEFDDNIFDEKEITDYERELLLKESNKIVVGNKYLKSLIPNEYRDKVEIINTTDNDLLKFDLNEALKLRKEIYNNTINMVWLGTDVNLKHLIKIINKLDTIFEKVDKEIILKVICNKPMDISLKKIKIKNIKWSREDAINELKYCHIGLMPLEDNEYTRGKCSFKAVQYMGAGIPIVISPVGMNKDIIDKNGIFIEDNEKFICEMIEIAVNFDKWIEMSFNSRQKWEKDFNPKTIEKLILSI